MKPAPFEYHQSTSIAEIADLLTSLGEDAKIIAGGQSLLPIMNMRLAEPRHLIDLSRVSQLRSWSESEDSVSYGAAITHQMIEDGLVPDPCLGLLSFAAAGIGYRAIRTRGTLGGSLAHADSAAEWPTVLSAVGAEVRARSDSGERRLPLSGFFHGFFTTSLEPSEFITTIDVPKVANGTQWSLVKTNRKVGEFAESLGVATWQSDESGRVVEPNYWLGAARDVPVHLTHVEELVRGQQLATLTLADVKDAVAQDLDVSREGTNPTERYQLQIHAVTTYRTITRPTSEAHT